MPVSILRFECGMGRYKIIGVHIFLNETVSGKESKLQSNVKTNNGTIIFKQTIDKFTQNALR
ncbi:hypothetical protein P3G55_02255 [Leptospira sp. 96542]|nr:hypothetical protein [Leptospira sp. 96542]